MYNVFICRRLSQLQAGLPHTPEEQLSFMMNKILEQLSYTINENENNKIKYYIHSVRFNKIYIYISYKMKLE